MGRFAKDVDCEFSSVATEMIQSTLTSTNQVQELEPGYVRSYDEISHSEIRMDLMSFAQDVQVFQNLMSHANDKERSDLELPQNFVTAWLTLVMAMVFGAANDNSWSHRLTRTVALVSRGMATLVRSLSDEPLWERATIMPLEVLSLLTCGLLKDQVGKSDDICDTYSEYLASLVCNACSLEVLWLTDDA